MTNSRARLIALAFTLSILAGCATPYQSFGFGGGYKDTRIDDETYRVQFSGNGYATRDRVHKFFMYRCAELTKQAGFQYFMIVPASTVGDNGSRASVVRSSGFDHSQMRKVHSVPIFIYSGGGGVSRSWTDTATIRMFNDDSVFRAQTVGWDAVEILDQLGPFVRSNGKTRENLPTAWMFVPGQPKARVEEMLPTTPNKVSAGA
jgi:hypothetical protein